jgi:hypothetical protein
MAIPRAKKMGAYHALMIACFLALAIAAIMVMGHLEKVTETTWYQAVDENYIFYGGPYIAGLCTGATFFTDAAATAIIIEGLFLVKMFCIFLGLPTFIANAAQKMLHKCSPQKAPRFNFTPLFFDCLFVHGGLAFAFCSFGMIAQGIVIGADGCITTDIDPAYLPIMLTGLVVGLNLLLIGIFANICYLMVKKMGRAQCDQEKYLWLCSMPFLSLDSSLCLLFMV